MIAGCSGTRHLPATKTNRVRSVLDDSALVVIVGGRAARRGPVKDRQDKVYDHPAQKGVDEHRDERGDLQYQTAAGRAANQAKERPQKDSGEIVDEANEVIGGVGADELQEDAHSNQHLDDADQQPDHLGNPKDV